MFTRPPWLEPRTAYIHVPFCAHHCGYCDFAVTVGQDHLADLYLEALEVELATLSDPRPVETLFVGGGTPTHLTPKQLERLLTSIRKWLLLSPGGEFSIEANPDSLSDETCRLLADHGVSRVSIGVQSFRPHILAALDRRHRTEDIPTAIEIARRHLPTFSIDLIFAAPGATLDSWQADLEAAIRFDPHHISTYGLTYEKGTPLWKQRHRGQVTPVTEDAELAMYEMSMDLLAAAGFGHYEISNFARPGHRCKHNERYWANEAYFGFGVGAARYVDGVRDLNVRNTTDYIRKVLAGESATFQSEKIDGCERALETLVIQLRRSDGIHRSAFHQQTAFDLDALAGLAIRELTTLGLLTDDGESVRLTRRGKCVADAMVEKILASRFAEV